mgnify:CR=1 FL=1
MDSIVDDSQRLDKWLNIACLFKTLSQAAKPAKLVKRGDRITIKSSAGKFINLTILGLSHKNVSAKEARLLYEKEEPELSEEARELLALFSKSFKVHRSKYKGRPTKKERRKMEQVHSQAFIRNESSNQ